VLLDLREVPGRGVPLQRDHLQVEHLRTPPSVNQLKEQPELEFLNKMPSLGFLESRDLRGVRTKWHEIGSGSIFGNFTF
jgi:hypothetical protein